MSDMNEVKNSQNFETRGETLSWQNLINLAKEKIGQYESSGHERKDAGFMATKDALKELSSDNMSEVEIAKTETLINLVFSPGELREAKRFFLPISVDKPSKKEVDEIRKLSNEPLPNIVLEDMALNQNLIKKLAERVASKNLLDSNAVADIEKILRSMELIKKHRGGIAKIEQTEGIEEVEKSIGQHLEKIVAFSAVVESGPYVDKFKPFLKEVADVEAVLH